jgi:hypothetical protein
MQDFSARMLRILPMLNTVQIDEKKCNGMVRLKYTRNGIEDHAQFAFQCSASSIGPECTPVLKIEQLGTGNGQSWQLD